VGLTEISHPGWVTVTKAPPTVIVPVLLEPLLFWAISKLMIPLPVPDAPEENVIQLAVETACHGHPPAAVTLIASGPPLTPGFRLAGLTLMLHGAPSCEMLNVAPPIIKVVLR
jgi:hypothetical protein